MIQVTAPGLPTLPRLMFDRRAGRAVVKARHATWRSYEKAYAATEIFLTIVNAYVFVWCWLYLPMGGDFILRTIAAIFVFGVSTAWLSTPIRISMRGFLARRVFATRTTVWFTDRSIAFRSSLFSNGILIQRSWRGRAVSGRFTLTEDPAAAEHKMRAANGKPTERYHLETARLLRLVLTTVTPRSAAGGPGQTNSVRSIPLTEMDDRIAERFTVVCSAAAALTATKENVPGRNDQSTGTDIDSA